MIQLDHQGLMTSSSSSSNSLLQSNKQRSRPELFEEQHAVCVVSIKSHSKALLACLYVALVLCRDIHK